jgi:hypothetical protein
MATFEIFNNAGSADIIEQNENYPEKMGGKTRLTLDLQISGCKHRMLAHRRISREMYKLSVCETPRF